MVRANDSWLHETESLFWQYLTVGVAFIPAGFLYAGLLHVGWESPLAAGISLALGFWTAHRVLDIMCRRVQTGKEDRMGKEKWEHTGPANRGLDLISSAFDAVTGTHVENVHDTETGNDRIVYVGPNQTLGEAIEKGQFVPDKK